MLNSHYTTIQLGTRILTSDPPRILNKTELTGRCPACHCWSLSAGPGEVGTVFIR